MGKSQKKRAFRRHNPVRVPDSHLPSGLDAAESTSSRRDAVIPIIQKIDSTEAQERTWACSAVSNLIHNDPSTRRLLQGKNIVGILIARLSDEVDNVVVEAAGALRNLCIDGGYDICAEMFNKKILEPLKGSVPKIANALSQLVSSPSVPEGTAELVFGLAESVITILWCLSETSNKALNAINEIQLMPFLMGFLEHRDRLPGRVVAAAAQCLYVLTDDNEAAIADLRTNSSYHTCLLAISQSPAPVQNGTAASESHDLAEERSLSIKLLCAGVLKNISPIPLPSSASSIDIDKTVIMPLVTPTLSSINLAEASARVRDLLSQEEPPTVPNPSLKHTPKSDHRTPTERELEKIETRLRNVQLALEILTGVCATLPDVETSLGEDHDEGDGDDDVDMEDDMEDETDEVSSKPVKANAVLQPSPTATSSSHLPSILQPLLTLINPTPLSFPPPPNPTSAVPTPLIHPPTTSALGAIHTAALECLNNVFLALALSVSENNTATEAIAKNVSSGVMVWDAIWAALGGVGVEGIGAQGQERRREVWEIAAGVLWGAASVWKGALVPNEGQVALLIQFCESTSDEQVKVKCIGTLECLAQHRDSIDANRVIADYFLSLMTSSSNPGSTKQQSLSPEPLFQAASALIDIYSDEASPYDINFRKHNYLAQLQASIEVVRKAVKSVDRKRPGGKALKARGEEVLENLRAFVKYRRDLKL